MKSKKSGLIVIIVAVILSFIGVGIRVVIRNPEYFDKPVGKDSIASYQDVNYSISNIETTNTYGGEECRKGYEYIMVTIKIENNSDKNIDSNNDEWSMEGKSGNLTETFVPVYSLELYEIIYPNEVGEVSFTFEKNIEDVPTKLMFYKNSNSYKGPTFTFALE